MRSLGQHAALPILLAIAFAIATGGAAPVPAPRPAFPPLIEKDGWRLEIHSKSATLKHDLTDEVDWTTWDVTLILGNTSDRSRAAAHLTARGNRLAYSDVIYVFWFPDDAVTVMETCTIEFDSIWIGRDPGKSPLAVPAGGHLQDTYNLSGAFIAPDFLGRFGKHKGRFCVTAAAPAQGLQSNTLRYNGCPSPPRAYSPLKLARAAAEAKRKPSDRGEAEEPDEDQGPPCANHFGGQRLLRGDHAPVPFAETPKIEKDSLRLEVEASGSGPNAHDPKPEDMERELVLLLLDTSKKLRSLDALPARGNKLSDARALRYVARFPDGQVVILTPKPPPFDEPWPGKKAPPRPLAVPAGGYVHDDFDLYPSLTGDFKKLYKKHEGRFCLTLVCVPLGLQSRTLCYNGCPEPPKDYAPLKLARAAEAARKKDK